MMEVKGHKRRRKPHTKGFSEKTADREEQQSWRTGELVGPGWDSGVWRNQKSPAGTRMRWN